MWLSAHQSAGAISANCRTPRVVRAAAPAARPMLQRVPRVPLESASVERARPEAQHAHARISNVRLTVAPPELSPSDVQRAGFRLVKDRAATAATREPW